MSKTTDNNNYTKLCKCGHEEEEHCDFWKGANLIKCIGMCIIKGCGCEKFEEAKTTHKEEDKGCGKPYIYEGYTKYCDLPFLCPKCKASHNKDYKNQ